MYTEDNGKKECNNLRMILCLDYYASTYIYIILSIEYYVYDDKRRILCIEYIFTYKTEITIAAGHNLAIFIIFQNLPRIQRESMVTGLSN